MQILVRFTGSKSR